MLNRRHLRVKVLQSLYAFYQSQGSDLALAEKQLLHATAKVHEMYLFQLMLLAELLRQQERIMEDNMRKHLPGPEDLHPNRRFLANLCLNMIAEDALLQKTAAGRKIQWSNHADLLRKLLQVMKQQPYYRDYMEQESTDWHEDTRFVLKMIKKSILPCEALHHFYEEQSIYWIDDWELVNKMLVKTLKLADEGDHSLQIMPLFKEKSDKEFALELFRLSILHHDEYHGLISQKTLNWEADRIALMDMIIMEMALVEILNFPDIPVKVSLNEYIELSKAYSTPKSKIFVNGVLDKLVEGFSREKRIPGSDL